MEERASGRLAAARRVMLIRVIAFAVGPRTTRVRLIAVELGGPGVGGSGRPRRRNEVGARQEARRVAHFAR